MNTQIEISSLSEYIDLVDGITDPDRKYLYRGQENAAWRVTSSAYRRLAKQNNDDPGLLNNRNLRKDSIF